MNVNKYLVLISPSLIEITHVDQLEWRKSHLSLKRVEYESFPKTV
jgi:hypothetical protein